MGLLTKFGGVAVGTSLTNLYTGAASKNMLVDGVVLSNIHATTETTVDVEITDDSAATTYSIITGAVLPVGSSLTISGLLLEPSDIIKVKAADILVVEATAHVKELDQ